MMSAVAPAPPSPQGPVVPRTVFRTSRALEFFSEGELTMQLGFGRTYWPIALLKELVDNALDACEMAEVSPMITVREGAGTLTVEDNGPGVPRETLEGSLDYLIRVSDKANYVSPTRGQLGNALKCLWAAPYVLSNGRAGRVDVETPTGSVRIDVTVDALAQAPRLALTDLGPAMRKTGTAVTIHWPQVAKLSAVAQRREFLSSGRSPPGL